MRIRWFGWRSAAWTTLLLLAGGVMYFALFQPVKVLPRLEPAPPFSLIDQHGQSVTHADLSNKVTLYSFLPTRHPQAVATLQSLQQLAAAVEGDADLRDQLTFVTISLDPEHDLPPVLAEFAASRGLPTEWRLLTGSWVAVKVAAGSGFGIYYERPPEGAQPDEPVRYEPGFRLVDKTGVIRARYSGAQLPLERTMRDLGLLIREENAAGASRLVNEAAHLFLCFPR